jgi:hypothetical protein
MSNLDERLERIENRVEMLLERQRLSRFDNLMFLIYPLVIFGTTLSLTLSLQYESIKVMLVWGIPMVQFLDTIRFLLLFGLGLVFLFFCVGYAKDSLGIRIDTLGNLFSTLVLLGAGVPSLFLSSWQALPSTFPALLRFPVTLPFFVAFLLLLEEARSRFVGWVASWFERSMPVTLRKSQFSLSKWHVVVKHRLMVKVSWSVGVVMYVMILMISGWRGQLSGRTVYDSFCTAALVVVTEAIMLWRL